MPSFHLECTTCGQRYQSQGCGHGMRSYCDNCGQLLEASSYGQLVRTLLLSLSCLVLLIPANLYPILRFSFQGQWSETRLITGAMLLVHQNSPVVGMMVLFTSVLAPLALHLMVSAACVGLLFGWFPRFTRRLWRLLFEFQEWGMIDVYLLALGVGAIKLLAIGSVEPRPALWLMLLFVLISGLCLGSLNPGAIWTELRNQAPTSGLSHVGAWIPCYHCGSVQTEKGRETCVVCEATLHPWTIDDRRVWAYLVGTVCLYVPANILPVMKMSLMGNTDSYTIIGGIMYLWNQGDVVPAIIVFCGSMIVPVAKIAVLLFLLLSYRWGRFQRAQTKLFFIVKTMGRWSMVDVFVLAVLVALGQMGVVATIEPQAGGIAFCGVVILTMFAANSFNPRWIWSAQEIPASTKTQTYENRLRAPA